MSTLIQKEVVIIGNQPAALVSALSLKEKNIDFIWLKGTAPAGGIFRGIKLGNQVWDAGMNLLEFTSLKPGSDPDISSYNPKVRYDATRFLNLIQNWLQQRIEIIPVSPPQMLIDKGPYPDLLISNYPDYLLNLEVAIQNKITSEISGIHPENAGHASQKHIFPEQFLAYNYEEIACLNHGQYLQKKLIEPWLLKISGTTGMDIPALYHRQAWAPLFYPETLIQFLQNPDFKLPPTLFSYPKGENFGAWMERAEKELNTEIHSIQTLAIQKKSANWEIETAEGKIEAKHLIYVGDIQFLLQLTGLASPAFSRGKLGFAGIRIPEKSFRNKYSVLNIPETRFNLFRLTDQTHCAGIEASAHKLLGEFSSLPPTPAEIREILETSAWIHPGAEFELVDILNPIPAFVLPVFENLRIFRNLQEKVQELLPGILLAGSAAELTSVSLNDQIVQGLQMPYRL